MNRRATILSLLLLASLPAVVSAASEESTAAAQAAGKEWLEKLDAGDYAGTWQAAASIFKSAVSAQKWQQASKSARGPLGALKQRSEKSVTFTRSLPGVPDGPYVVIEFDAIFENKARSIETLTLALDQDGAWRVAGYFIK